MKNVSILPIFLLLGMSGMAQSSSPGLAGSSPAKGIGLFAYPKNQQSADQQLKDETECYSSAKQQTGVDPQPPPPAAPTAEEQKAAQEQAAKQAAGSTPKGGAVKGSAKERLEALPLARLPEMQGPALRSVRRLVLCAVDASKRKHKKKPDNKQLNRLHRRSNNRRRRPRLHIREP